MSWSAYIDKLISAGLKHVAIYGYSGIQEYARSAGFPTLDRAILSQIIGEITSPPILSIPDWDFIFVMSYEPGKPGGFCAFKGGYGLIVFSCKTLAIIGIHDESLDSRSVPCIIAKNAGDHLIAAGY